MGQTPLLAGGAWSLAARLGLVEGAKLPWGPNLPCGSRHHRVASGTPGWMEAVWHALVS